jgi:DNA-binding transcriptional LysR family regulator
LPEAGEVLLPLAKRVIADADNVKMEMNALTGLRRGTLRLGMLQSPATSIDIIDRARLSSAAAAFVDELKTHVRLPAPAPNG